MKDALYKIGYMVLLTIVFTAAVVVVKSLTAKQIALNEQLFERQKILWALNLSQKEKMTGVEVDQIFKEKVREYRWPEKNAMVYASINKNGDLESYAFPIEGPGFWGPIHGYVGIKPDGNTLVGISFTKHSETPGLGARIEEKDFREQFHELNIEKPKDGLYVQFLSEGQKTGPGEIHAITGATQTSKALKKFLNEDLKEIEKALKNGVLEEVKENV